MSHTGKFLTLLLMVASPAILRCEDPWRLQDSGVHASLRGLCVVDRNTVWSSGTGNTVIRTVDGGQSWVNVSPQTDSNLDFRDIHAFNARNAVVVSAGQPARIYLTKDGGTSWTLALEHPDKRSFMDALSFFDRTQGIIMGDPIDGRVQLIETGDGGKTWKELSPERCPEVVPGEAGFAASGTNMVFTGEALLIALGGAEKEESHAGSRVLLTTDGCHTWQSIEVPVRRSVSSGIFSLAFADSKKGIAVGGNYLEPDLASHNIALTSDGGKTWRRPMGNPPGGYRSGATWFSHQQKRTAICVGPNGTDISEDDGDSWSKASSIGFHAVASSPDGRSVWASGADGRIGNWIP